MLISPKVTIIILNWNNAEDTIACLESVSNLNYPNFDTLVVDNGSTDSSVAQIRRNSVETQILELGKNLGYAEGNNVGIHHAISSGSDYVLILNNDTLVAPGMLTELVRVAEDRPDVGMVGPLVFCTDPPDKLFTLGSFVLWTEGNLRHRGMFQPLDSYAHIVDPEPVDFIMGCGVLVRKAFIQAAGVLDRAYFLNYEDVEWGIRAWRYGYQVWVTPKAIMWHKISATLGIASPANTYYMTRNALLFFWKYTPITRRWLPLLNILFRTFKYIIVWTIKPSYRTNTYRRKRGANLFAVRDFFLGKFGEMGPDVAQVCYGT